MWFLYNQHNMLRVSVLHYFGKRFSRNVNAIKTQYE